MRGGRLASLLRGAAIGAAVCAGSAAGAQEVSARIGETGLAATAAYLEGLPAPTDAERFGLGAVRALRGVERALQTRWRHGITPEMRMVPVLRLPVPENPAPAPFTPDLIAGLFEGIAGDMEAARGALAGIEGEVALLLDLGDLWFDIDGNGARAPGEGVAQVAGGLLGLPEGPAPVVRFDTADAAWLTAYTHFLSATAHTVLAFDPTEAIARTRAAAAGYAALDTPPERQFVSPETIDLAATVIMALERQPDPAHTGAVLTHLEAMIAQNRVFWDRVAVETDDDAEWIPNDAQTSALGLTFPPGTGDAWLEVLAELEAVLAGEALLPYWRVGPAAGLNLRRLMQKPPEVDIAGMVQGATLLPYVERGRRVSDEAVRRFDTLVRGEALIFAIVLN